MTQLYEQRGGDVLANTTTPGHQDGARIAYLSDGRFVIVWRDASVSGGDTSGTSIRGQIFNADGSRSGTEFLVNSETVGNQWHPSVAALDGGGFVVGWTNTNTAGDGSSYSAKAQLYDSAGARSGGEILLNTNTLGAQSSPVMAALDDGGFVATWNDGTGDGDSGGIKAQLFDAAGGKLGGEIAVNSITAGLQFNPSIATLADGRFVIVWEASSARGQIFNADGSKSGSEFAVSNVPGGIRGTAGGGSACRRRIRRQLDRRH